MLTRTEKHCGMLSLRFKSWVNLSKTNLSSGLKKMLITEKH